ncbi:hypothetical protein N7449_012376 [Penicillium cf. viridicatum]|uniref:Uncharacterized protein n=1 Tax=Penicillium cf. viridicatum TaxID=2972119 RepID=A0A9W9LYU6_9EURO|nr:hypothetical protein N7449_012376 [Penicillium cf. viridicatum]
MPRGIPDNLKMLADLGGYQLLSRLRTILRILHAMRCETRTKALDGKAFEGRRQSLHFESDIAVAGQRTQFLRESGEE